MMMNPPVSKYTYIYYVCVREGGQGDNDVKVK